MKKIALILVALICVVLVSCNSKEEYPIEDVVAEKLWKQTEFYYYPNVFYGTNAYFGTKFDSTVYMTNDNIYSFEAEHLCVITKPDGTTEDYFWNIIPGEENKPDKFELKPTNYVENGYSDILVELDIVSYDKKNIVLELKDTAIVLNDAHQTIKSYFEVHRTFERYKP